MLAYLAFLAIPVSVIGALTYRYVKQQATNALYNKWKLENSSNHYLEGKYVLVVGGTQGIGSGIAIRAAQLGASVIIAGRNETLAKEVIKQMEEEKLNAEQSFSFIPVDASLMSDLTRFVKDVKKHFEDKGQLDHLFISSGTAGFTPKKTLEGNDMNWMVTSYSKYFITEHLIPILQGSCTFILRPSEADFDISKMEFNDKDSFLQRFTRTRSFIDAITLDFQRQHPNLKFYHLFPGFVNTNFAKNNGVPSFLQSLFVPWGKVFGRDPLVYADHPIYVVTDPNSKGGRLYETNKKYPSTKFLDNPKNLDAIRKYCKEFEDRYV